MSRAVVALCVDDYGLHRGVDRAVQALAARGRVNAVSAMTGGPSWREGAPALHDVDPERTDVGLHLDLTEHPLTLPPRRLPALILRAYAGALDVALLRAEIAAQLDAFERALGRAPDHVDGHQHVHQLPRVREALAEALRSRYAGRLPWWRSTRAPSGAGVKARIIQALGDGACGRLARAAGLRRNARLLGVYGFDADAAGYRAHLDAWLTQAADGDLLMCHAAVDDPQGAADALRAARQAEAEVLLSPAFDEALQRAGVRLAPISRWPTPSCGPRSYA